MLKRYIIFFIGLLLNSFGVAFVTKSTLGTSPIAAIPYSLSLIIPRLSLGNWIIIFNLLLIIIQTVLLRRDAKQIELILQVGISFVFGYFIDFSIMCLQRFQPEMYGFKILFLLTGCVILAFGAYLEVIADVVMLPRDAFVRTIAKLLHKEYGGVRIVSDVSMTVIAGALCLIFLHKLSGVREGTIIAALITGNIVKIFVKSLNSLTRYLLLEKKSAKRENTIPENNFVLTISREYGSGGKD